MRTRLLNLGFADLGGNLYECELFRVELDPITLVLYKVIYGPDGEITYEATTLEQIEEELSNAY